MNPFAVSRAIEKRYKSYLRSNFRASDPRLAQEFAETLESENLLVREPFVSLAAPFETGDALEDLGLTPAIAHRMRETAFTREPHRPYLHQSRAHRRIAQGLPTVVATGTGSGKTEAFLLPILDHVYRTRGTPGPKAILLYPMNALAIDQNKRIGEYVRGLGISYGAYTGATERGSAKRPEGSPEELRFRREEFESNPPDLFSTNYQMLEYLLLRGDGRRIFAKHNVRFVVLDEVHTYRGALGTDVAFLVRRLRAALEALNPGNPEIVFVGTSATLQKREANGPDPAETVATFFSALTGAPLSADGVITESRRAVAPVDGAVWTAANVTDADIDSFDLARQADAAKLAARLTGSNGNGGGEDALRRFGDSGLARFLRQTLVTPLALDEVVNRLAAEPARAGVPPTELRREVEAALALGPALPEGADPLLPRVHRFFRGMPPFFRCVDAECGALSTTGGGDCAECGAQTRALLLCRTCGQDYLALDVVTDERGKERLRLTFRVDESRAATADDDAIAEMGHADLDEDEDEEPDESAIDDDEILTESEDERVSPLQQRLRDRCERVRQCNACGMTSADDATVCENSACGGPLSADNDVWRSSRGVNACPVCNSNYGRGSAIRAVKLGNSPALAWIGRTLLEELPFRERKLLIFCDSRQDAAHQARYIRATELELTVRRAILQVLRVAKDPLDLPTLAKQLVAPLVAAGMRVGAIAFTTPRTTSAQRVLERLAMGLLLREFVYVSKRANSLERLALLELRYPLLDALIANGGFDGVAASYGVSSASIAIIARHLLDAMRSSFGAHFADMKEVDDPLRERLLARPSQRDAGYELARDFGLEVGRGLGRPVAFSEAGEPGEHKDAYDLRPIYGSSRGGPLRDLLARLPETLSPDNRLALARDIIALLVRHGLIKHVTVGLGKRRTAGLSIVLEALEVVPSRQVLRCRVCNVRSASGSDGEPCPKPRCAGSLGVDSGENLDDVERELLLASEFVPMLAEEHSAAISMDDRDRIEREFMREPMPAEPSTINVLACTPTLELGVNIGALEAVAMRNVPPTAANYAQRAGRTGRATRMGVVTTFAQPRPHDAFFFDHPEEMIAGAINAPNFSLGNREALARHVRSIALEAAQLSFDKDLSKLISRDGEPAIDALAELEAKMDAGLPEARKRAKRAFADLLDVDEARIEEHLVEARPLVRAALDRRAEAIAYAARKYQEIGVQESGPRRRERDRWEALAVGLRVGESNTGAYLPRVLAEASVIPGYAFPRDPGSLSLGYDAAPIFTGRVQAQREFAPFQTVYARGERWEVKRLALFRPDQTFGDAAPTHEFVECACGHANERSDNRCKRESCGLELDGAPKEYADIAAFAASRVEADPLSEEERRQTSVDVRRHLRGDGDRTTYALGDLASDGLKVVESRHERILTMNHGRTERGGPPEPYRLCLRCGEAFLPPVAKKPKKRRGKKNAATEPAAELSLTEAEQKHLTSGKCDGEVRPYALGHTTQAEILRIEVPPSVRGSDGGLTWAWSVGAALQQGAIRRFSLDENDLAVWVVTRRLEGGANEEAVQIALIDDVTGGSGIVAQLAASLPSVARAALEHLADHSCHSSCYRCLRTYYNARYSQFLDWRSAMGFLRNAAAADRLNEIGHDVIAMGLGEAAWQEAREHGCGSPAEYRLLRALLDAGLPDPMRQFEILRQHGSLLTIADFAYPDAKLLVYVDSLQHHSTRRQREHDARQTRELQAMGWHVLRFLGTEVWHQPEACANDIRQTLERPVAEAAK
jgi:superfamily II DNA/RNA helicase/very-short-patch-repair endonuclease